MPTLPWPPQPCRSRCAAGCGCVAVGSANLRERNLGRGHCIDNLGDHSLACPRTGLLARRARIVEWAWCRDARPWALKGTSCPNNGSPTLPRRALPQMTGIYGATPMGGPRRLASRRSSYAGWGRPERGRTAQTTHVPGARARRRPNPLRARVRGRGTLERFCNLARAAPCQAARLPGPTCCAAAQVAWARRWWNILSVASQRALGHTALGWASAVPGVAQDRVACLDEILVLAWR